MARRKKSFYCVKGTTEMYASMGRLVKDRFVADSDYGDYIEHVLVSSTNATEEKALEELKKERKGYRQYRVIGNMPGLKLGEIVELPRTGQGLCHGCCYGNEGHCRGTWCGHCVQELLDSGLFEQLA